MNAHGRPVGRGEAARRSTYLRKVLEVIRVDGSLRAPPDGASFLQLLPCRGLGFPQAGKRLSVPDKSRCMCDMADEKVNANRSEIDAGECASLRFLLLKLELTNSAISLMQKWRKATSQVGWRESDLGVSVALAVSSREVSEVNEHEQIYLKLKRESVRFLSPDMHAHSPHSSSSRTVYASTVSYSADRLQLERSIFLSFSSSEMSLFNERR